MSSFAHQRYAHVSPQLRKSTNPRVVAHQRWDLIAQREVFGEGHGAFQGLAAQSNFRGLLLSPAHSPESNFLEVLHNRAAERASEAA
jgi:hypothetical protein